MPGPQDSDGAPLPPQGKRCIRPSLGMERSKHFQKGCGDIIRNWCTEMWTMKFSLNADQGKQLTLPEYHETLRTTKLHIIFQIEESSPTRALHDINGDFRAQ